MPVLEFWRLGVPVPLPVEMGGTGADNPADARANLGISAGGGGAVSFLDLTDTPASYSGTAHYLLRVNTAQSAIEFVPPPLLGDLASLSVVTSAYLAEEAVTYPKIQDVTAKRLLGRYDPTTGTVQEIALGSGLSLDDSGTLIATGGSGGAGVDTFLELTDTPNAYSGQALKAVRVNAAETGVEFGDVTSTGGGVGDTRRKRIFMHMGS
jgi:hypothetical protein